MNTHKEARAYAKGYRAGIKKHIKDMKKALKIRVEQSGVVSKK